jgi:hypothetical protein
VSPPNPLSVSPCDGTATVAATWGDNSVSSCSAQSAPDGLGQTVGQAQASDRNPQLKNKLGQVAQFGPALQRESYRVGPKVSSWPKILTVNPY